MDSAKLLLRENPFPASPSSERYQAIGSIETARKRLTDAIDRREGPGLLVGPSGTGKSLLCTLIAAAYRDQFDVVLLAESRLCTRRALLQHLLHHLGLPYSDQTEGELRLALIDRAASGGPENHAGLLIIVDEAHTLPSRLLEELRMMSGIVRNGNPRVQLVLAGGPSLDERFAHPRMEAFSQRIGTRCYLHSLGQLETGQYIRDSLRQAGADPKAIDDEAIEAVYYAADGIPRLINQTMRRSVVLAESERQPRITAEIVQRAWADLQQLPSPISEPKAAAVNSHDAVAPSNAVVEFGTLDEADSDPAAHDPWEIDGFTDRPSPYEPYELSADAPPSEQQDVSRQIEDAMADTVDYEPVKPEPVSDQEASRTARRMAIPEEAIPEEAITEEAITEEAGVTEEVSEEEVAEEPMAEAAVTEEAIAGEAVTEDVIALFGEGFEEEESLDTGFALSGTETAENQFLAYDAGERAEGVERDIHREIVSINAEAILNESPLDFDESTDAATANQAVVGYDSSFGAGDDITVRDDSHMLVIEDDVELEARADQLPPRGPARPAAPEDAISLQSMFNRLREG